MGLATLILAVGTVAMIVSTLFFGRRRYDRALRAHTNELEQRVADLETTQRLQEQFVSNTAHELLSPLTVSIASLETLEMPEQELPAGLLPSVERAHRASVRMKRLVENVLLTSGSMHRVECEREPFDADHELRAALHSVEQSDKAVYLRSRVPLYAVGDAERFRILVEQLLADSDRNAPPRSVIRVAGYEEEGKTHITITDEGPPVPADQHETAFRRFQTVDANATRRPAGPGLFLARHLAVAMGGQLDIDDVAGGAQLHLVLPAAEALPASTAHHTTKTVEGMLFVPVEPPVHSRDSNAKRKWGVA
jgi:two-component system sensor histidine kinase BaeS